MNDIETNLHLYQPPMYRAGDGSWHEKFVEALLHTSNDLTWDPAAILSILSFNYACGNRTLLNEINRKPWLSSIQANGETKLEEIPHHDTQLKNQSLIAEDLGELLREEIVQVCKGYSEIYILLSGGLDSRIIAAIASKAASAGEIDAQLIAVTWGLPDSRDVVYARKISNILGLKWIHIDLLPKVITTNIELSVNRLACLVPGIHLHGEQWFKNVSKDALVLAASYGDSIGRAEYSGKHILELEYLKPINKYGLIKSDIFDFAYKSLRLDLKDLHYRTPSQPKYILCEHEMQAHYMRGMIAHAMSLINDYCKVYQVFTNPKVYSYMWSIHPAVRTNTIYKKLLGKLNRQLLILPWTRTNRSINGNKKGANLHLQPKFHKYYEWIGGQLFEALYKKLDIKLLHETGIFQVENIKKMCLDIKRGTALNQAHEIFIWLIGFSQFSKWLNNIGKTVKLDSQNITKGIKIKHNTILKLKWSVKIKKIYLKHKCLVDFVKNIEKVKKKILLLIALVKYPPKRN